MIERFILYIILGAFVGAMTILIAVQALYKRRDRNRFRFTNHGLKPGDKFEIVPPKTFFCSDEKSRRYRSAPPDLSPENYLKKIDPAGNMNEFQQRLQSAHAAGDKVMPDAFNPELLNPRIAPGLGLTEEKRESLKESIREHYRGLPKGKIELLSEDGGFECVPTEFTESMVIYPLKFNDCGCPVCSALTSPGEPASYTISEITGGPPDGELPPDCPLNAIRNGVKRGLDYAADDAISPKDAKAAAEEIDRLRQQQEKDI